MVAQWFLALAGLVATANLCLSNDIALPSIFRDHMVLQQGVAVPVWGKADPDTEVLIKFAGQTKATQASKQGDWMVYLDPMPASGKPEEFRIGSKVIRDVLVGEVWLCSGQSNMRWIVGAIDRFPGVERGETEIAAPEDSEFRLFSDDGEEIWQQRGWQRADGEQVARFSATAYFFGKMLRRQLAVPVGVINVSRGGTSVQAWTPREFALRNPFTRHYVELEAKSQDVLREYNANQKQIREARQAGRKGVQQVVPLDPELEIARLFHVANLYDAHIEALAPFAVRGVVWYQGESNASRIKTAQAYGSMLQDLIEGWRNRWDMPEMPWLVMQLPCWSGASSEPWPWVRQGQWEVSRNLTNVSITTTADVADSSNLHPAQKREAGERLAQLALANTYAKPVIAQGPSPSNLRCEDGRLLIDFDNGGAAIKLLGDRWNNVEIAGVDGVYHAADASWNGDLAIVISHAVKAPRAIRYGWRPVFTPSLLNSEGLPAVPFAMWVDRNDQVQLGILPSDAL